MTADETGVELRYEIFILKRQCHNIPPPKKRMIKHLLSPRFQRNSTVAEEEEEEEEEEEDAIQDVYPSFWALSAWKKSKVVPVLI